MMSSRRALLRMGPHEEGSVEKTPWLRRTRSWRAHRRWQRGSSMATQSGCWGGSVDLQEIERGSGQVQFADRVVQAAA